jgi:hypothetical protein
MPKMTQEEYDEIYRRALAACRPKPKPVPPTPTQKAEERWSNQPTEAVIDAAIRGNEALAKRVSTMKIGELSEWQQSILDVQRAVVRRGNGRSQT